MNYEAENKICSLFEEQTCAPYCEPFKSSTFCYKPINKVPLYINVQVNIVAMDGQGEKVKIVCKVGFRLMNGKREMIHHVSMDGTNVDPPFQDCVPENDNTKYEVNGVTFKCQKNIYLYNNTQLDKGYYPDHGNVTLPKDCLKKCLNNSRCR